MKVKKKIRKDETLCVRLDKPLLKRLLTLSEANCISVGEAVRQILMEVLK